MEDPSERYEQLKKSGATAISSEMMFGEGNDPKLKEQRWSTPAAISALSEKLQDQLVARSPSFGSGGNVEVYKQSAKETADKIYEKGTYVANGAYTKASQAKHAALDWITSMTAQSSNQ